MSRNALIFAAMCLVWGVTFLPAKIGAAHVPPVFFAASRFLIAGAAFALWAGRDMLAVPRAAWPRLLGTALLVNTLNYALLFWGVAQAPSGVAAIVNFATIPIFSILASRAIEGTPIGRRHLAAIGLGCLGIVLLFAARARSGIASEPVAPLELWGLAAVIAGTASYCVGAVFTRSIAGAMPTLALAGWQTIIGGIGLALLSALLEPVAAAHVARLLEWPVWPSLALLVMGGSLVGFSAYMRLLRDWGAFRAGLYAFISPVIAVGAGVVVLGEPFGPGEAAGAVLMFAAAAIALRR